VVDVPPSFQTESAGPAPTLDSSPASGLPQSIAGPPQGTAGPSSSLPPSLPPSAGGPPAGLPPGLPLNLLPATLKPATSTTSVKPLTATSIAKPASAGVGALPGALPGATPGVGVATNQGATGAMVGKQGVGTTPSTGIVPNTAVVKPATITASQATVKPLTGTAGTAITTNAASTASTIVKPLTATAVSTGNSSPRPASAATTAAAIASGSAPLPPTQLPPLPDGWAEHFDPTHNRLFYFNNNTRQSSWTRPVPLVSPPPPPQ